MTILQGLKTIDRARLPHPEWEFVFSSKDLKKFSKTKDHEGWTIRTVDIKNSPWKNLYVNWLLKDKVPSRIDELQEKQNGKATFVVYPSWKWKKSGTILIEKDRIIIEATKGAIINLMRYGRIEASYFFEKGKLVNSTGNVKFLKLHERKKILQAPARIKEKNIILEWAITRRDEFVFYRIEDIGEAAKLLLKKYS